MKKILLYIFSLFAAMPAMSQELDHNFNISKNLTIFNTIYKNLELAYVDTLDADDVIGMGIKAMLYSLDPYTEYYPEEKLKELDNMITGKYAGIGSIIRENSEHGCCMISEPYPGMPAAELGLQLGDLILAIDDSTMVGKTTSFVSEHLRGEAGSTFKLKIKRITTGQELTFNVTRRTIQMPAVPYYGMLNDEVGYIMLDSFTDECARNVRNAFIELRQKGMKSLVFDLRNNGGGSVAEAIEIMNLFVPNNETILTMKGKLKRSNNEYRTSAEPLDSIMPIAVLVNQNTASASEITAGAMQDLDRAVIMGQRTYGKGLVQSTVDVPYNGQLKMTTSKYFIPSGRCIQAINYHHGQKGYTEHVPDSLTKVFYTRNGREVRDGGGIKPDIELQADTLTNIAYYLVNSRDSSEVLLHYKLDYIAKHPQVANPGEFLLTDADFDELKERIVNSSFKYDRQTAHYLDELEKLAKFEGYYDDAKEEFAALRSCLNHDIAEDLEKNRDLLKEIVANELMTYYYHQQGAQQFGLRFDSEVKAAIELLMDLDRYRKILR